MQLPESYPELALLDINNGVLGGANVNEPPLAKKQYGFIWGEKPDYSHFNFLFRRYYQWIKYREERSNEVDAYFTSQW